MSDYSLLIIKRKQTVYCNVTLRHLRATIVAVGNQYSERVFVDLDIWHAMRVRQIVVCGLPGSTVLFHKSHKRHDFRNKKVIEHEVCVLIVCTICV